MTSMLGLVRERMLDRDWSRIIGPGGGDHLYHEKGFDAPPSSPRRFLFDLSILGVGIVASVMLGMMVQRVDLAIMFFGGSLMIALGVRRVVRFVQNPKERHHIGAVKPSEHPRNQRVETVTAVVVILLALAAILLWALVNGELPKPLIP
jgi:hypothetical protein